MKKIVAISAFILCAGSSLAQDISFSEPYANPLYLNPAFAGTDTLERVGVNYRNQWPGIPGYYTMNLSYDRHLFGPHFSVGFIANSTVEGDATYTTNNASLILGYQFNIKSVTVSTALQATIHNRTLDERNLSFDDYIDPLRGFIYNSNEILYRNTITVPDFSFGTLAYNEHLFVGLSLNHLTQPDEAFIIGAPSPIPLSFCLTGGYNIKAGTFIFTPTFVYLRQQQINQLNVEFYLTKNHFTFGLGYRNQDAPIFTIGYQNKFMRIGYSYDLTISQLGENTTWVVMKQACVSSSLTNQKN